MVSPPPLSVTDSVFDVPPEEYIHTDTFGLSLIINVAQLVSPSVALLAELVLLIFWLPYVSQKWVQTLSMPKDVIFKMGYASAF